MERHSTEFAAPFVALPPPAEHGAECILPCSEPVTRPRELMHWVLLALAAVLASLFLLTCWSFAQTWKSYPPNMVGTTFASLAVSLTAMGAAAGSLMRNRQIAAENARLAEMNERLLQERDLLRTIIDTLPDYIYAKDRDGHFLLNNLAHAREMGASSPASMRGKSDFDYFPRPLAEQFFADEKKIMLTGESVINQEQYKARPRAVSGEKTWSISSKVLWRGRKGEVLGTVGITRDIQDIKQAQAALRQSEQRLHEVLRRTRCILNSGVVEGPPDWRERALQPQSPFRWHFPVQNVEGAQELCPLELPPGISYQQAWSESRNEEDFCQMNQISGHALLNNLPYYRNEFHHRFKAG